MSNDLLFSVLPRLGKEAVVHETQKVEKLEKAEVLKSLSDEHKELVDDGSGEKSGQQSAPKQQKQTESTDAEASDNVTDNTKSKKGKGPKHLDIYV